MSDETRIPDGWTSNTVPNEWADAGADDGVVEFEVEFERTPEEEACADAIVAIANRIVAWVDEGPADEIKDLAEAIAHLGTI